MGFYRHILRRAISLSWNHKYLWFFGLFAAAVGSGGFEIAGQGLAGSSDSIIWFKDFSSTGIFSQDIFWNIRELAMTQLEDVVVIGLLLAAFIGLLLFFMWLATVSQAAIVQNTVFIQSGKEHSFQTGVKIGMKKFWSVFLINIMVKIAIVAVLLIINLPLIASLFYGNEIDISWLYIVLVLVFIPTFLFFSLMMKYAIAYIVIKGDSLMLAFKRSWQLFYANWLVSVEMAFLLFLVSFVTTFLALIALSILLIPAVFAFFVGIKFFGVLASLFVIIISWLIGMAVIMFFSAFNATFQIAAWTDLFSELIGRGGSSKLERVVGKYLVRHK